MRGLHSLTWVKACAASQAKCRIKGEKVLRLYLPLASCTSLGPLLFGSLPTGVLFFYWLDVTAYLTGCLARE
ncbi:hypothetical protein ES705_41186 [subsurface metagenome]